MKLILSISSILLFVGTLSADNYQHSSKSNGGYSMTQTAEPTIKVADHVKFGKILTDSQGMTLYMFTPDKSNESTCYGQCAVTWPPLLISSSKPTLAPGITGTLDTKKRRDGTSQVTYNGMPLYYYDQDKKPGDVNGQNVENKWFVVNPGSKK